MCDQCDSTGLINTQSEMVADQSDVMEFIAKFRSLTEEYDSSVVIPGLLQLVREHMESSSKSIGDVEAKWQGGVMRLVLDGLMGCTLQLERLVKTSGGLVPLRQLLEEAAAAPKQGGNYIN